MYLIIKSKGEYFASKIKIEHLTKIFGKRVKLLWQWSSRVIRKTKF